MTSDEKRCAEHGRFKKIDTAFRAGDLEALRTAVEDPDDCETPREMAEQAGRHQIAARLAARESRPVP